MIEKIDVEVIFYLEIFAVLLSTPFDLILAVFRTFFFFTPAAARPTRVFYGIGQRNE